MLKCNISVSSKKKKNPNQFFIKIYHQLQSGENSPPILKEEIFFKSRN